MNVVEVPATFVGRFKVGDNLVFNARILCALAERNEDGIFNKLIVLQCGSILEAALLEIIYRAQTHRREGVPNISEEDRSEIENKQVDKLAVVIDVMKKYSILDRLGDTVYSELHRLRKFRNKVHIQLRIEGAPADESAAFSAEVRNWALKVNHQVLVHLSDEFKRPESIQGYVAPLYVPVP